MNADRFAGAAAVVALLVSGCTSTGPATPAPAGTSSAPVAPCSVPVQRGVLPEWARAGFSDPSPSGIPFVLGDRGAILGVIFGHPLTAPPAATGRANKILWTPAPGAGGDGSAPGALIIEARLAGSAEVVRREVPGGPGPSIIDLPRPGCWRLTLTWSGRSDTLDLRYEPRAP
jgi:hypothetical protein